MQTGLLKLIVAIGTMIGSLIIMFYYSVAADLDLYVCQHGDHKGGIQTKPVACKGISRKRSEP